MTIAQALKDAELLLKRAHIASCKLDARLLLQHALGCDHTYLVIHYDEVLTEKDKESFSTLIQRRAKHEPVAKIVESKEFWSLPFITTADTLDPRPDSETLIESCVQYYKNRLPPETILDIGTGTGCLLLSLLSEFKMAKGTGVDISLAALNIANQNAIALDLESRACFQRSNWLDQVQGSFDLIISNPPYILDSDIPNLEPDLSYDPRSALTYTDSKDPETHDGLSAYRLIAKNLHRVLNKTGIIVVEYGQNQHESVRSIFESQGFTWISDYKDLGKIIRCSLFTIL